MIATIVIRLKKSQIGAHIEGFWPISLILVLRGGAFDGRWLVGRGPELTQKILLTLGRHTNAIQTYPNRCARWMDKRDFVYPPAQKCWIKNFLSHPICPMDSKKTVYPVHPICPSIHQYFCRPLLIDSRARAKFFEFSPKFTRYGASLILANFDRTHPMSSKLMESLLEVAEPFLLSDFRYISVDIIAFREAENSLMPKSSVIDFIFTFEEDSSRLDMKLRVINHPFYHEKFITKNNMAKIFDHPQQAYT